ncbi:tectonic-1 [Lingula anatina]|uniref:Tectonic-1 n=1 Tax=Lingula anatina TaxID=7574 RepID=A0A1S3IJ90_LINAN|nr:tectonic-1 [Lingula anatina]|eukprot:XP_013398178.1 tectonic-1 [Lingula anatina]
MDVAVNVISLVTFLSILSLAGVLGQTDTTALSASTDTVTVSVSDSTIQTSETTSITNSATASSASASASVTVAPTTGSPTTGTTGGTIQTTTTPIPTGRSIVVPRNTDIGRCTCDLTSNACDINCCCDSDCTVEDVAAFSQCSDSYTAAEDRLCIQENIILQSNIAGQSPKYSTSISNNLFCIQIDNYAARNYFEIANKINTTEQFDVYLSTYGGPSFQPTQSVGTTYNQSYKSGYPVYTIYPSNAIGNLGLPTPLITKQCDDSNPAAYLEDQTSECIREVADLAVECTASTPTALALKAGTYSDGFKIVASLGVLNDTLYSTDPQAPALYNSTDLIRLSRLQCLDSAGVETTCTQLAETVEPLQPTYDAGGICNNVVTHVEYTITHNSTYIVSASVKLTLKEVSTKDFPMIQKFSISFSKIGESNTFKRSGNPGYVVGQPVMAGKQKPISNGFSIALPTDRNSYLTLVTSTATGDCEMDSSKRVPVNFGENMRTGCLIRATLTNVSSQCSVIQELAKIALLGNLNSSSYVATFGNSQPEYTGDWIPILGLDNIQSAASGGGDGICNDIRLGMHLEIVYINVGALANPQPKIIGVNCKFDDPQRIQYRCIGPYCQPELQDLTQPFEVTSSVVFIDASQPAVTEVAAPPTVSAKLPADFWYPFYSNDGT